MDDKPKTKQEAMDRVKKYVNASGLACKDWLYGLREVEVCDIGVEDKKYRVPAYIGNMVKTITEDLDKNNEMVPLGNIVVRAYMVKSLEFKTARFVSLSEWAKKMELEQNPDLFKDIQEELSPRLKEYLENLKLAKQLGLKALSEGSDYAV